MKVIRVRPGFTLIELMLFLAIAGVLAVGIIAASGPAIARQRYNSGVQTFEDFLQGLYASVTSVQNATGDGRSSTIIYGKFITFGEPDDAGHADLYENTFHIYDIIGDAYDSSSPSAANTIEALKAVNACLFRITVEEDGKTTEKNFCSSGITDLSADLHFVNHDQFKSQLAIENTLGNRRHIPASGAIMIVRSPTTGSVSTYVTTGFATSPDNYWLDSSTPITPANAIEDPVVERSTYFTDFVETKMSRSSFDFCLYSEDMRHATSVRRNVRIVAGASNSSGIILMPADDVVADSSSLNYSTSSVCQQ